MTSVASTSPTIPASAGTAGIGAAVILPALVSARIIMGRCFGFCAAHVCRNKGAVACAGPRWSADRPRSRFAGRSDCRAAQDQQKHDDGGEAKNDPSGRDAAFWSKSLTCRKMGLKR